MRRLIDPALGVRDLVTAGAEVAMSDDFDIVVIVKTEWHEDFVDGSRNDLRRGAVLSVEHGC